MEQKRTDLVAVALLVVVSVAIGVFGGMWVYGTNADIKALTDQVVQLRVESNITNQTFMSLGENVAGIYQNNRLKAFNPDEFKRQYEAALARQQQEEREKKIREEERKKLEEDKKVINKKGK